MGYKILTMRHVLDEIRAVVAEPNSPCFAMLSCEFVASHEDAVV